MAYMNCSRVDEMLLLFGKEKNRCDYNEKEEDSYS